MLYRHERCSLILLGGGCFSTARRNDVMCGLGAGNLDGSQNQREEGRGSLPNWCGFCVGRGWMKYLDAVAGISVGVVPSSLLSRLLRL